MELLEKDGVTYVLEGVAGGGVQALGLSSQNTPNGSMVTPGVT